MTKSDLINAITEKANLQHKTAETAICLIFDLMIAALKKGERIEIRDFGSFQNRHYGSYTGRNPKTGQTVMVTPKVVPFFKVGKELKEKVNAGATSGKG